MIMDCVSSICGTVEAAMINKTIRQILNSMGPACVTHQVQLNRIIGCLLNEKLHYSGCILSFQLHKGQLLWTSFSGLAHV